MWSGDPVWVRPSSLCPFSSGGIKCLPPKLLGAVLAQCLQREELNPGAPQSALAADRTDLLTKASTLSLSMGLAQLLSAALSPSFIKQQFFIWKGGGGGCRPGAHDTGVRAVPWKGISVAPVPQSSVGLGGEETPDACTCGTALLSEMRKAQGSFFSLLALHRWGTWHVADQLRVPDHNHRVCFCRRIRHLSQR